MSCVALTTCIIDIDIALWPPPQYRHQPLLKLTVVVIGHQLVISPFDVYKITDSLSIKQWTDFKKNNFNELSES